MAKKNKQDHGAKFLVQHSDKEEFTICFETSDSFRCWSSAYPPPMDPRFKRKIKAIRNQPAAIFSKPAKGIIHWDKGTYKVPGAKSREDTGKAFLEQLFKNKLGFTLDGKNLQGRFIIRHDKTSGVLLLYKQKDRFAKEEDMLDMELQRSLNKWVPTYDPARVPDKIPAEKQPKKATKQKHLKQPAADKPAKKEVKPVKEKEKSPPADPYTKTIKGEDYSFHFYRTIAPGTTDIICLVIHKGLAELVLLRSGKGWKTISAVPGDFTGAERSIRKAAAQLFKKTETPEG
jgi:hypothetical protein